MPEIIDRFADEHFTLDSISETRQVRVRAALTLLDAWLGDTPLERATDEDLRRWLVSLLKEGRSPSTVGWYLKAVRSFYHWCWRARLISAEDWMRLAEVSSPRGANGAAPRPYSGKQLTQMWTQLNERFPYTTPLIIQRWRNGTSPWRSVRKHAMRLQLDAILDLALVCGLRRTEIYRLSIDDCHWDNKYIVVHGKRVDQNDKVREVPYPDSTRDAIRAWFRMRALLGPEPGLGLWLSVTGPEPAAEMSFDRLSRVLRSFGEWELHRLRHTCATERLRAGMKLEELRAFLGHSNIAMTLRYAQLVREDIHKSSERIDADFQKAIRRAA